VTSPDHRDGVTIALACVLLEARDPKWTDAQRGAVRECVANAERATAEGCEVYWEARRVGA
jgi:hypothetical protein